MQNYLWIGVAAWVLCVSVTWLRWDEHLQIHMLDVGQGDAILITTREQNHILVDGGPDDMVLTQLGEVLPFFFKDLDLVVLTHPHADHVVGLISVLQRFRVGAVLLSAPRYSTEEFEAFEKEVATLGVPVYMAEANTDFRLGTTTLDILYPFEPTTGDVFKDVNEASVVMKVSDGEDSILLTGDALAEEESALVALDEEGLLDLSADLLKAGHHGSHSSNSEAFLEKVAPRLLLISCGFGNSYGHPHRETLDKAAALDIEVLRTDTDGRLSIVFDDESPPDMAQHFQSWLRSIFAPSWRSFSSSRS